MRVRLLTEGEIREGFTEEVLGSLKVRRGQLVRNSPSGN